MTNDVAETYVRTKLEAQGFTLVAGSSSRYRLKKSGSKATCGALVIPSLEDIPEEVAVDLLDSVVLEALDAAIKDPAFNAK